MKAETLTAAAMQADDSLHADELIDLVVCLEQIKRMMFCPANHCSKVLDVRRAVQLTPLIGAKACSAYTFCSEQCAAAAIVRTQEVIKDPALSFRTLSPGCFKWSFPHVRLRPEPDLASTENNVRL